MRGKKMKKTLLVCVSLTILLGAGTTFADLNEGLVAYYPFNGNANDESGNGNHGVEYGGLSYTDGVVEEAGNFDGVDDFIEITPSSDVSAIGDFAISVWTYLIDWKEQSGPPRLDRHYIFDGASHSKTVTSDFKRPGFALLYDGSSNTQEIHDSIDYNDSSFLEQNTKISIKGAWHHHVFMRIGDTDYTYFDGKLIASTYYKNNKRSDLLNMQHNWFIGTFSGNNPNYYAIQEGFNYSFYGLLDEMYIHNRALSESEIQQLYNINNDCQAEYQAGFEAGKQLCINNPTECGITGGLYTEEDMQNMVNKLLQWDANKDKQIGLVEAVKILRDTAGVIKSPQD